MSTETDTYVNLLYKKSQGAAFTNPLTSPMEEAIGSSAIMIKPSQIWTQPIPTTEPACQAATPLPEGIAYGTQSIAVGFPWIIKYTSVWLSDDPSIKRSFYYKGTSGDVLASNILIGAIPPGQTLLGRTYKTVVYSSNDGVTKTPIDSKFWYFDRNSGYLTFLSSVTYPFVYMDFWRYIGETGFSSESTGPIGSTGTDGPTGFTGPKGKNSNVSAGATGDIGMVGPTGPSTNIMFDLRTMRSEEINFIGNITIPANTNTLFEFSFLSFITMTNKARFQSANFVIIDPTTEVTLYTLYSETFLATARKTIPDPYNGEVSFSASIANSTSNDIQGLIVFFGTFTGEILKQVNIGTITIRHTKPQQSYTLP
jgi:hypothetical protein